MAELAELTNVCNGLDRELESEPGGNRWNLGSVWFRGRSHVSSSCKLLTIWEKFRSSAISENPKEGGLKDGSEKEALCGVHKRNRQPLA
jgi:hypothetical protein